MEFKNYYCIRKRSWRYRYFFFLDVKKYFADNLFIRHQVRVFFMEELRKQGTDYMMIFCKVRKKDVGRFQEALEELKNKMLLMGYPDYPEFCEEIGEGIQKLTVSK